VLCNELFLQRSTLGINAVARAFLISTEGGELCSDVMVSNVTHDPDYWRKRAEEARTLAEQMAEAHTKSLMLGIAASYEKIAKWAEQHRDEPR
jgi:DNA-binding ferritin-like protein